jgi:hypothetical protein
MAQDTNVVGALSGTGADVDATRNQLVNLPYDTPAGTAVGGGIATAGFAAAMGEADAGSVVGNRETRAMEVTTDFRLRTAVDVTMFNEYFAGGTLNARLWTAPVTTATVTVASGSLNLNAAASLASGAVARVQSYSQFPCYATYPTYVTMQLQFSASPVANSVHEWGAFIATGVAAPTDGAFFRITAASVLEAVVCNNSVETSEVITDFATLVGISTTRQFLVTVGSKHVDFWIDNIKVASIDSAASNGASTSSMNLPITFRSYNSALVVGTACLMKVGAVNVTLGEMNANIPWSHVMAGAGGMVYEGYSSGTPGSTTLVTNSIAPSSGALSNTTSTNNSLGGEFAILPTLTANTDGIVCYFRPPLGAANQTSKSLYITGVTIDGIVTTALIGGPVYYSYKIGYGSTAVSLATTTTTTAKEPVRIPLGHQAYAVTAPAGTLAVRIQESFADGPIVLSPGEYIHLIAQNLGTVTSAGVIRLAVNFRGYWR